ncbi:U3 snoRNP protein, partial [Coemansia sp. 'formosensis']
IRELDAQMPLRLLALHAVAPGLRYASLVPPKPLQGLDDSYIEPLHVLVEFAASNKWPDDIVALHKVKTAFLLRLGESYTAAHPESRVELVTRFHGRGAADGLLTGASSLTAGARENMDYEGDNCIDIRHASGLTFRLGVVCEREGELLAKKAGELRRAGVVAHAEAVEMAHRRWARNHRWRPRLHQHMLDVCQRHHPAASLTVRLLKRWLARHMLLGHHVPEEVAELLAARAFTDISTGCLAAPATAYAGFVRCLRLLAEWRWSEDLLAVDFSADTRDATEEEEEGNTIAKKQQQGVWASSGMAADAAEALQKAFAVAKEQGKIKDCVRVATEDDPDAAWWGSVSPVVTRRLRTLARASAECLVGCLDAGSDAQLAQVFTTPLKDYDFVIRLNRDAVCRKYEQLPRAAFDTPSSSAHAVEAGEGEDGAEIFKNLLPTMQQTPVRGVSRSRCHANPFHRPGMVGFDPVALYVRDLANVYGDSVLLFNDVYGGCVIAGLWNPAVARAPVPFAASIAANMQPDEAKSSSRPMVRFNVDAVVEEMTRLGEGIVESIELLQRA